ncbi:MAG TPA: amino acid adenylation domain-containing protein, partial [Candidatus Deferrimicrobium sp.]|nr:amino acid adenylation domain-containing protein [Candidatus Deferrimicrobium sp.]
PGTTAYNISAAWILEGYPDRKKLEDAFLSLVKRHESFRTSFVIVGKEPVQQIHDDVEFAIAFKDLATEVIEVTENTEVINFIRAFDLTTAPLFRAGLVKLAEEKHILVVDMHHIIADGMSTQVLVQDFSTLYAGNELPQIKLHYKDYAEWQNRERTDVHIREQGEFWQKEFAGEIPILELPIDYARPAVQDFAGNRIYFEISIAASGALKSLALDNGTTLYTLLLALYNMFLAKLSGREDIVIGTPVAGRRHADLEKIMGMFVNTLALRNYPVGEMKWLDFLDEVKEKTLNAFENQDYPFEELLEKLSINRDAGRNPLFDTMFDLQDAGSQKMEIPGLKLIPLAYENKTAKFDFSLSAVESDDKLLFTFEYSTKLFNRATVERFAGYFKQLINSLLANGNQKTIAEIEILTADEIRQLLYEFNNHNAPCFSNQTIPELFVEQVQKTPDSTAVVSAPPVQPVRLVRPVSLTYRQLNENSDRLAGLLIEKGVRADDIVGIMMGPAIEMVIGLWGILKSGGAYLPIDPDYPPERIDYMLKDSGAKIMVGNRHACPEELNCQLTIVNCESFMGLPGAPLHHSSFSIHHSNHLAYLIYTSGTTGKPKGVMVEHRNLAAYVQFFADEFELRNTDVIAQQASFTFDAFVEELYPILLRGGKTIIFPREEVRDIEQFADSINRLGITIISSSPLVLAHLNRLNRTPAVRLFAVGGDVLKSEYIGNVLKTSSVHNGYGPTEATVCATFYKCSSAYTANVPIGKPIIGYRVYILNRYHGLQPLGVPGELCIGGSGVTRGYLNRPELTAEKFGPQITLMALMTQIKNAKINKSFSGGPGGRLYKKAPLVYRSGDLARWLADGNIEFLGRIDSQVKIRGYRVELAEIEKQLLKHNEIKETVVIDRDDAGGNKYLCAYIVPVPGRRCDENQIRKFLAMTLPHYMIPAFFVTIEQIPLTPSSKPDRTKLPEPVMNTTSEYIPPRNEIEEKMVKVWNDILYREGLPGAPADRSIGIEDNFFHVGGDSIKAVHVAARLKEYDLNLKINDLFLHPVISELSAFVTKDRAGTEYTRDISHISHISDISPEILSRVQRHIQDNIGGNPDIEAVYPLTPMQKTMLYHDLSGANKDVFFIQLLTRWQGTIDPAILKTSMQKLVERHGVYRTIFIYEGLEEPLQAVLKQRDIEFIFQDISGWQEEKKTAYLEEFLEKDIKRGFDLTKDMLLRVALFKMDSNTYYLVRSNHYILEDGWCTGTVFGDLYAIYESLRTGSPLELPETFPYRNYIYWLEKQDKAAGLGYWQDYLAGYRYDGGLIPVIPGKSSKDNPYQFKEYSFIIPGTDILCLKQLAADCQVTLNIVFQTLWGILLQMYNKRDDVVFGAVVSGRTPEVEGIETMVGLLINTVPVRVKAGNGRQFRQLLKHMQANSIAAKSFEYLPLTEILAACNLKANIIDSLMTFQNFLVETQPGKDRHEVPAFRAEASLFHQSNYSFNIVITPQNSFEIKFMYNAAVHDEIFCKRIEQHLKEIIRQVIIAND